jgi:DNA topoisomerase-1
MITYMRTDSTRLSAGFRESAKAFIKEQFGDKYQGFYRVKNEESSQDAHEAIRPTHVEYTPESVKSHLTADEYKLYKLIYARALASLMSPAISDVVSVNLHQNGLDFAATGSQLKFDGYLKVYSEYEQTKDRMLPSLDEGEKLDSKSVEGKQHFTEPPLRYSEARLIKAMEEKGIGRPSTYATIIDTLQQRLYVTLEKSTTQKTKVFIPTPQGILTDEQLELHFPTVINVGYTAEMETELDEIAEGKRDSVTSLHTFYDQFIPLILQANETMEKKAPEFTGDDCPTCGKPLVFRDGRFGRFISCSTYPECKYTAKIATDKAPAELTDKICPECGSFLVKRKSRYGRFFYGCSTFPKCKHIENIPYKKKTEEAEDA